VQVVNAAEESLVPIVLALRVALEAVGGFWVAIGFAYALMELITAHLKRQTSSFTAIRLTFSRYLSLALEFQLASDILSTSVGPSWARDRKTRRDCRHPDCVELLLGPRNP